MFHKTTDIQAYGKLCAVLAALFNGTVGVISVNLFNSGLPPESVAFLKCFLAFVVIGFFLLFTGKIKAVVTYLQLKWYLAAVCSFFGFFILYHFETAAYSSVNVAVVVFCLFGASTVTTFLFNSIIEKRWLNTCEVVSILLAISGLFLIFLENDSIGKGSVVGLISAIISGVGYGLFLVMTKQFKIGSGLIPVFSMLLFGLLFLFIPFIQEGFILPSVKNLTYLLLLALLPTIGGFWCTTKALTLLKSQSVQLIELTEPLFAIIFGFIFLGQLTTKYQVFGGGLILSSIMVYEITLSRVVLKKNI